jgi:hypothetical protein
MRHYPRLLRAVPTASLMLAAMATLVVILATAPVLAFEVRPNKNLTGLLWSFERLEELQNIQVFHAGITRVRQFPTDGHYALQLDFEPVERPQIDFSTATVRTDWRPFGALALDVTNPSNEPISFSLEVQDAIGAIIAARTKRDLGPRETGSYALPINSLSPVEMGMRGEPLIPGFRLMAEDHHPIDIEHVIKFRLFLVKPAWPRTLVIDNVRLAPGVTYDRIVDKFGQFALSDWSGKLKGTTDFGRQQKNEEAKLKAHPTLPSRDEYGGWASGPQLEATGYFRTAQRHGRWWLITPSGHLFFSLGMNSVNTNEGDTVIKRREHMFQWLPASRDPLATHYGVNNWKTPIGLNIKFAQGRTFQFYTANLERKYGRDWRERWKSITLARLRAWGFNTIGNWSDPRLYEERRMPYTATLNVKGVIAALPSGSDYWSRMVDPFDTSFAEAADRAAQSAPKCRDDPWCLGYFVDNELSWGNPEDARGRYGLALGALSLGATSPAKQAFVDQIQKRYASIREFNNAWNSHVADWPQLLEEPFHSDGDYTEAMRDDMRVFVRALARRYFQTIRDALRKYDPNHLYLGSRFASVWYTPESVEACAEFCDVMSFNIYQYRVEHTRWQFLDNLGKPVIISEFHMGAGDRGMFHPGLVSAPNQAARAISFMNYVRSVVDNPVFVGCHYFKYNDQPLTGRPGDGENYSIGFTTVVDGLYPEMIEAAKTVSAEMYQRRSQ